MKQQCGEAARAGSVARASFALALAVGSSSAFGQPAGGGRERGPADGWAGRQQEIGRVAGDEAAYAAAIVARWEGAARDAGRWNESDRADLLAALTRLDPENLLLAGEAQSYGSLLRVIATGRAEPAVEVPLPGSLGQAFQDLVYTPVPPCRIVDTRRTVAGALAAGSTRTFDADGSDLAGQGGSAAGCGIPFAAAQAVTMTIVAVQPASRGQLAAWGRGPRPTPSSILNYAVGDVVANTATVPVVPGSGDDFSVFSLASTHLVVDVLGYFAAPTITRLDCVTVLSEAAVPIDEVSAVDALCPAGRTSTGGGYDTAESTIAFPGLFMTSSPLANGWRTIVENRTGAPRSIETFARCCRIPGR